MNQFIYNDNFHVVTCNPYLCKYDALKQSIYLKEIHLVSHFI